MSLCRLTTLRPHFIGAGGDGIFNADMTPAVKRHGIGLMFLCPCATCAPQQTGEKEHDWQFQHFVAFANPLDGGAPFQENRPLWTRIGDTFDTLQLSPSILSDPAKGGCGWHGFVGMEGRCAPGEVITC